MIAADVSSIADVCSRLLGRRVTGIDRIYGGRNSQVFRVECAPDAQPHQFVAKQYFAVPEDARDRLGTEFHALRLLRARGITAVPASIAMDAPARCAVYQYVPGVRASLQPPTDGDIEQAVRFLASLNRLARHTPIGDAAPASEACFSIDAIVQNLAGRIARLRSLADDVPGIDELRGFLAARLEPFVATLDAWTTEQAQLCGIQRDVELPGDQRTLSPSDFGFHNALRDETGRLVFVDFEYFGWDDPSKTIVDVLHHPAMPMTLEQRRAFAAHALHVFADTPHLAARARMVYPWFGLKWCVILLNEFVPADLRRRSFAGAAGVDHENALRRQLDRAEQLFDRIEAEYRDNPYFEA